MANTVTESGGTDLDNRLLNPLPRFGEREQPRDLVDEVSHYFKCCTCQKPCARVEHMEWPQMRVSKCCGGVPYRAEYTESELVDLLREAIDQEEVERAELLVHAIGRLRLMGARVSFAEQADYGRKRAGQARCCRRAP
jgi:hypothetical protein